MSNVRLVIVFLGVTLLASLGLIAWLLSNDKTIPDVFVGTVGASLGALAGILTNTRGEV